MACELPSLLYEERGGWHRSNSPLSVIPTRSGASIPRSVSPSSSRLKPMMSRRRRSLKQSKRESNRISEKAEVGTKHLFQQRVLSGGSMRKTVQVRVRLASLVGALAIAGASLFAQTATTG